jgi:methyl-accepting chemotaxis protein
VARDYRESGEIEFSAAMSAVAFILFVAVGSAYIILAKLFGVAALFVTFVPVAIMVAYALVITLSRSLRMRDDQLGDNLYYMGFLFTLTSLGVSLYQFSASRAAEEIVQNFGIAIGSTIAGIGLRVIFNQMRRDPIEIERTMRLELAEAARRVRRELDASVVEFGYFRRTAQQSAADSFDQMTERFDDIVAKLLASLEAVTERLSVPVEAATRALSEATREVAGNMGAALAASAAQLTAETERLSERVGAIAGALDEVVVRLKAMQTPDRVFEIHVEPVMEALTQAVERIAGQSDTQAQAVEDALAIANRGTERSNELVDAMRQDFEATATANRASLEWAGAMIKATAEVLTELKTNAQAYTEGMNFMLERTDQTMRDFTEVLARSGVDAATRAEQLAETLPALEARARALTAAATQIAEAVDNLRAPRKRPEWETVE